jgi:hypothetical protein
VSTEGDNCGHVEVRDDNIKARKGDQWVDAAWVEANFFGCFPQGGGGGIAVGGLPGAAGECYLSWMVPKRRTALQQHHFGTVAGVVEKYENSRLPVSDTCRDRVVSVELAGGAVLSELTSRTSRPGIVAASFFGPAAASQSSTAYVRAADGSGSGTSQFTMLAAGCEDRFPAAGR